MPTGFVPTFVEARGIIINPTQGVHLEVKFTGSNGLPAVLTSFPQISIIQPNGEVYLSPTSAGVYSIDTGIYGYDFVSGINSSLGVWTDYWQGQTTDGYVLTGTLQFIIDNTQIPQINSDGYESLGDNPGFDYSPVAIHNINKLLKALKARLNSAGQKQTIDPNGNITYVVCDIFSVETLVAFLAMGLTEFNQIPFFSYYTFDDTDIINLVFEVLVEGATIWALESIALIERGREFAINDNGVQFTPPLVSELLHTEASAIIAQHLDKLKYIKNSMRPGPIGLSNGSQFLGGVAPIVRNLRLLRARQIV